VTTQFSSKSVAVLGLGYVGCVSAACLADIGHSVAGVDRDEYKVRSILEHKAPFYEPGLEDLVRENVAAGRLTATTDLATALADADVALVCVGTPSEKNGNMSLEQLRRVCEDIAAVLPARSKHLIVAIRSTVFPGTCEDVVLGILGGFSNCSVVSNPEFLREGQAVKDFTEPSLLVVGGNDRGAVQTVADLYAPLNVSACLVALRTAEMIKYSCNAFHALKIAFANEIGALCARNDVPADEVMTTLCQDVRLNISPAYLKPGFAFGGSCLPKDLRALSYRAARQDLSLPLLESVLPSNQEHLDRFIEDILSLPAKKIGIFGLAFKENTDDLRESPVVTLIEQLIGKGRELRVFDPHIQLDSIYGANRNFVLNAIPHIGRLLTRTLGEMLENVDHVVITQRPSADFARTLSAAGLPVLDLTTIAAKTPAPAERTQDAAVPA
jgi:GDP-mannose 6-dehydrogenase